MSFLTNYSFLFTECNFTNVSEWVNVLVPSEWHSKKSIFLFNSTNRAWIGTRPTCYNLFTWSSTDFNVFFSFIKLTQYQCWLNTIVDTFILYISWVTLKIKENCHRTYDSQWMKWKKHQWNCKNHKSAELTILLVLLNSLLNALCHPVSCNFVWKQFTKLSGGKRWWRQRSFFAWINLNELGSFILSCLPMYCTQSDIHHRSAYIKW